ncbi:YfhO family protein [Pedobacter flavus]|uniref:YfhO family protein n=1 Tax=Pedobacter flavus TaxID=3113906 RepID=A0ABU7H029_9SPHI|nr:YfhO family protein [Pedobacter sp. VNH31]MEE1884675.1 YfhO family protein [Pedobacter sp. VNH31]
MKNWLNKNAIHIGIIAFFVVICFAYFSPVIQGKAPVQGDVLQAKAMQKEIMEFRERDGKAPLWTNQMFGGMPAYQIWVKYPYNISTYGIDVIKGAFPEPVGTVLLYLIGAYLLFCVLKVNPFLAAAGAIAVSFTSYNFIIIAAGHANKALAIGFFAPILAGIILALRGKYWLGGSLTALFLALEIRSNHVQMTYYLFIAIFILIIVELYDAYKNNRIKPFTKSIGFIGLGVIVAIMVNAGTLWTTYEYSKETIRGNANLTVKIPGEDKGLSKEYAYQWSQGVGESFSFLIPNIYGGATSIDELIKPESNLFKALEPYGQGQTPQLIAQLAQQLGMQQYWGLKPGTAGPYYFGAIVCFLFVFGLFIVKHRWKWWILATSVLLLLLSFGKNFPLVSDLFFNYVPMYNKFRAVESILAVVGLLVPLLAVLAIQEALDGKYDQRYLIKKLTWSAGITGGIALIVLIMPTLFFSFTTPDHAAVLQALTQGFNNDATVANTIMDALVKDRISLARADAFRTLVFVLLGFGLIWALISKKLQNNTVFILLAIIVLIDLWQVDKRYLNSDNFVPKSQLAQHYQPREVDTFIAADKDPNFRVYDATLGDPFKSSETSFFHKTVGGFHSARLMRIQEIADNQFYKSVNQDVLDMFNTKYIISRNPETGAYNMQRNPTACGNAWFVGNIQFVKNADQEMQAISSFDPKNEVVVDQQYRPLITSQNLGSGAEGFIKLVNYHPDHLTYEYSISKDAIAVFSEVYYNKGWKMYIDGEEQPYFRANYILRAAQLKAGNHKVEFKFEPKSYYLGEKISLAGSLLLIGGLGMAFFRRRKDN